MSSNNTSVKISNIAPSSKYTKTQNVKQTTIYGITVQGTGLTIDEAEYSERRANLNAVRKLEEQERTRRIGDEQMLDRHDFSARIAAHYQVIAWEEEERERRIQDVIGAEEYRRLLANKVSASISSDILKPSLRIYKAAGDLLATAKQAGQDLISGAGGFASRAVHFFGGKASEQAHVLSEKVQDLSNKAYEQAQVLTAQVADKTSEQAHILTEKAQTLGTKTADQAHAVYAQTVEMAQNLGEKVVNFGSQTIDDAVYIMTISKLNYLEETERLYRTTTGLTAERFLLALRASSLVKDFIIEFDTRYRLESEPNRWYATSVLEEFERTRRMSESYDKTAQRNANRVAHIVHLHNIQVTSYKPQPLQIKKVSELLTKKADALANPAVPVRRAAAAM